ncbi:Rtf2 RING-finger-domain-containing protein [Coniella lustricola]|uniref:Rtf2 RING-finger-domain-containing protein n=1 Tax=Coniella lustricola TaxID=2025994 RepID=A0A2T3A7N5_9PEZI|nr:Rtf2 RING-finger-domain-containing protein [Coniella lustricola]
MGNDGGSIPKRRELVKEAARNPTVSELKATALESLSHAWTYDPLSSEPLDMENVASDWRGRLYNYESILKGLIPSEVDPEAEDKANGNDMTFSSTGIKSLRDIVRLNFKRYKPADAKSKEIWACPVSLKELGPATKAVYIVPCGHVFADVAIKEITDQEHNCPECSGPFEDQDIIPILPIEETELARLSKRMENLRAQGLTHSRKADKSNKKKKRKAGESGTDGAEDTKGRPKEAKRQKADTTGRSGGINNPMTASLTAKVLAEQEERNKRRKLASASA